MVRKTRTPVRILLFESLDEHVLREVMLLASRSLDTNLRVLSNADCNAGFDSARGQWSADVVIEKCLAEYSPSPDFLVGLTSRDLYVPSLNFVFGLARVEVGSAIVSWHRLRTDQEDILIQRIAKEVVHEVGHLEGLLHCRNNTCAMAFSNELSDTDRKCVEFCDLCRRLRS